MTRFASIASSALLTLGWAAAGQAAQLCVSPDMAQCSATIQEAVDAAAQNDEILIHPKADGSAYSEAVVIATPDLALRGASKPSFGKLSKMVEFAAVRKPVDFRNPDVKRWMKHYPDAKAFKGDLGELKKFAKAKMIMSRCPEVVVEVCDTIETGPELCGVDSSVPVFLVEASGTTFSDLTIRHGNNGIELALDATDTTVQGSCFRNNGASVDSADSGNHRTTVRQSFIDGASRSDGFDIRGNDVVIEYNLLLNTEGVNVDGAGYIISRNAISITTDDECIEVDGPDGLISSNVLLDCDGHIELDGARDTLVVGNLMVGVSDDDGAIEGSDVPESSSDPNDPGNLRTVLRHNVVRLISDDGIDFGASESMVVGNVIERTGNDSSESGIDLRGSNNEILYNLIRANSQRGISVRSYYDEVLGEDVPSDGTVIRGNVLAGNHTSGIHFYPGSNNTPGADGTLIDDNIIADQDGEGVSIPAGDDPVADPAATNTTLTNNLFENNRTDLCSESLTTTLGAGNTITSGGITGTNCVVEPN